MKLRLLLSLLFIISTTFASVHEVEHIQHADDSPCLVCHVNDNLTSADLIDEVTDVELITFEKVEEVNNVLTFHEKKRSNQNRAPPKQS